MMNKRILRRLLALLLALGAFVGLWAQTPAPAMADQIEVPAMAQELADYLFAHGELPDNFLTKSEARELGWKASKNDLSDVAPGYALGGDTFGNREKLLPEKKGRTWRECDCDYLSGPRNEHRIVYSNDGLVYYTPDLYQTFLQLYPSEDAGEDGDDDHPLIEPQEIVDYLALHGELPPNFLTKDEAEDMGWDKRRNYVSDAAPGYSIGGDRFGNYEGLLPKKKGRQYYECDCYYESGPRSAYRLIYSNDGLYYYTEDHYESFTQMYPTQE